MNDFLENHPSLIPHNEIGTDVTNVKTVRPPEFNYIFSNLPQLVSFNQRTHFIEGNPFIGRTVSVIPKESVYFEMTRFFNQAIRFFTLYGQHIWHATFGNFTCMFLISPEEFYLGFRKCLQNLPNLKSLDLEVINITKHDDTSSEQFKTLLSTNPLPKLPQLETLDLTITEMPSEFHEMFITTYGSQLKKIDVKLTHWNNIHGRGLENLTELQLRQVLSLTMLRSFLLNLNSPKLQKVSLHIGFPLGVTVLFQLLSQFEELRILKVTSERGATTHARLTELVQLKTVYLRNLHTLELQDSPKLTYQFLVGLPELRSLVIWKNKMSRGEEVITKGTALVQLRKYLCSTDLDYIYQSNIWKVVPKMKSLKVKSVNAAGKLVTSCYSGNKYAEMHSTLL